MKGINGGRVLYRGTSLLEITCRRRALWWEALIDRTSKGRLVIEDIKSVSRHYVEALRLWRKFFLGNWERVIERALKEKPGMTDADMDVFRRNVCVLFRVL